MDARTTISNMAVEASARGAIFVYDEEVKKHTKNAKYQWEPVFPDEDAEYVDVIEIDMSQIEPNIAFPHKPANVFKITELEEGIKKSQEINSPDFPAITEKDILINEAFV
jgi:3-isopropylmalate/(R)-2-methylmalate dehydratase large subunit